MSEPGTSSEGPGEILFPGFSVSPAELDLGWLCRIHKHISHDPEGRARAEQDAYVNHLRQLAAELAPLAATEKSSRVLAEKLNDYRQGYRKRLDRVYHARFGTMNIGMAGGSGLPQWNANQS